MAQYLLIGHLSLEEMQGGKGTMIGYSSVEAENDEAAVKRYIEEYGVKPEDLNTGLHPPSKKYTIFKLCTPPTS